MGTWLNLLMEKKDFFRFDIQAMTFSRLRMISRQEILLEF